MNGNYSIGNVLTKEPVVIAAALRSILWVLVLMGIVVLNLDQLAGIALGLELLLGLFARQASTSVAQPTLALDTPVLNPAAPDGDDPPPDLIVAVKP